MIQILLNIVAPVFVIAGLGALLDRTKALEARTISRVIIYLASPALAFYSIANTTITGNELSGLILFFLLITAVMTLLAWLASHLLKLDPLTRSAFIMSMVLVNVGNYGVPINEFAFGQAGLERAIILMVVSAFTINTLGVFLASWGKSSLTTSFINVFKVPLPYAVLLGTLVNLNYLPSSQFLLRVSNLLGQAAIPLMLVMLGAQVSRTSFQGRWGMMVGISLTKLIGGAMVGIFFATVLGLSGVTRQVAIVDAATPTAVMATVLATEFESDSKLVSSIVLMTTLLSLVTMPIVLFFLMN